MPMLAIKMLLAVVFFVGTLSFSERLKGQSNSSSINSVLVDSIPRSNQHILNYLIHNGSEISPTYQSSVCTELLIGVLKNFTLLSKEEKNRIRIITEENVHQLRLQKSPIPKGVYYALTESKKGIAINRLQDKAWGFCAILVLELGTLWHCKKY